MTRAIARPATKTQKSESYSNFVSLFYLLVLLFSIVSAELVRRKVFEGVVLAVLTVALGLGVVALMFKEIGLKPSNLEKPSTVVPCS
jgi:hypothetical protein